MRVFEVVYFDTYSMFGISKFLISKLRLNFLDPVRMGSRSMLLGRPVTNMATRGADHHAQGADHHAQCAEEEPFELTEEIEAQTIGNLLPDDKDLFTGVIDEVAYMNLSNGNTNGDDIDDDIFFTGGGMELEGDELDLANGNKAALGGSLLNGAGPFVGEHPFGEHPSRTLFVRNINSNVEDSELRLLFEVVYSCLLCCQIKEHYM
jgi:hypothetical protein